MTPKRFHCGCLAFLSGATGLTAQIVWLRRFGHVFGGTVQAAAVVVATTLLGLALGAYFLGKKADQRSNPLRFAGWLMILTGLTIALGIVVFAAFDGAGYWLVAGPSFWLPIQSILRMGLAAVVLLPPTVLLGGMLPALVRGASPTAAAVRTEFGGIYGLETAGGAVGALLTGFGLIRWIGLNGTLLLASVGSAVAGALVLLVSRGFKSETANETQDTLALDDRSPTDSNAWRHWCHVAAAMAGFASLGMEIIWTRLLLLVLGGDSFAYTTVVTSFLLGLASGALLARRIVSRSSELLRLFAWFQIGVAATSLGLLLVFLQLAAGPGQSWLAMMGEGWGAIIGGRFGFCLGLLLIPTVFIGLGIPTLAAVLLNGLRDAGKQAGRLYAANTSGNVLGALATGFLLLPHFGVQMSFVMLAGLNLTTAALVVILAGRLRSAGGKQNAGAWNGRAHLALVVLGLVLCVGWRWVWPIEPLGIDDQGKQQFRVTYYREGPIATVMVMADRNQPDQRVMAVDGVIIGESEGGVDEKQRMLAHLPFLLRPETSKAKILTIGLGTGILAGELIGQPGVEKVICVELSPAVIEGAKRFDDLNGGIQQNPNVSIIAADGIHYLRQHNVQYDAIISDAKSRPGHAGNVSFFSRDYYQLCQMRIAKDGVFAQWVSLETPTRALQIILKTFVQSFPHSVIGVAAPDSIYLLGSIEPLPLDVTQIQRHLESPCAAGLRHYNWRHACDILGLLIADGASFEAGLSEAPVNTLDRPHLEFEAGEVFRTLKEQRKQDNMRFFLSNTENATNVPPIASDDADLTSKCRQAARLMLEGIVIEKAQEEGWLDLAAAKYRQALQLAEHHHRLRIVTSNIVELHAGMAFRAREAGDVTRAAEHYFKALSLDPDDFDLRLAFAQTLAMMDKPQLAEDQLRQAIDEHPNEPRAHLAMGIILRANGQENLARQHFRRAIELDSSFNEKVKQLGVTDL